MNPQTAMITGASRGIGKAVASLFAQKGYDLILTCCHSYPELADFSRTLSQDFSIRCQAFQTDMGDASQVAQLFREAAPAYLDVLVNNAGISYRGLLSEMSAEDWRRVISVNLDSCFYTCKYSIPLMLKKHSGKIINISSVWGTVGASMEAAYSASKGGMNALTKALAKELAPSNIQVNAIACGVIDTSMNEFLLPEERDALTAEIPADRVGTPEEVARLVWQTVQAPAYMTGQIITIDGGWY